MYIACIALLLVRSRRASQAGGQKGCQEGPLLRWHLCARRRKRSSLNHFHADQANPGASSPSCRKNSCPLRASGCASSTQTRCLYCLSASSKAQFVLAKRLLEICGPTYSFSSRLKWKIKQKPTIGPGYLCDAVFARLDLTELSRRLS